MADRAAKVKVVAVFVHPDGSFSVRGTLERAAIPVVLHAVAEQFIIGAIREQRLHRRPRGRSGGRLGLHIDWDDDLLDRLAYLDQLGCRPRARTRHRRRRGARQRRGSLRPRERRHPRYVAGGVQTRMG